MSGLRFNLWREKHTACHQFDFKCTHMVASFTDIYPGWGCPGVGERSPLTRDYINPVYIISYMYVCVYASHANEQKHVLNLMIFCALEFMLFKTHVFRGA